MSRAPSRQAGCAICGREVHEEYRPFCSKRCADVDLQRWLAGRYAVAAVEDEDGTDEAVAPDE